MSKKFSIIVLISGAGSNLQAIMDHIDSGEIDAQISAVISNRVDVYGLERAEKAGIPNLVLEHKHFLDRESFDQSLAQIIESYAPDLIILAGFMRILSDEFVKQFENKLINIHPSLLPKYRGLHTHKRALEDFSSGKIKNHGASVHFVIPELDAGTVVLHGKTKILDNDTEETLEQRVHKLEHIIYPTVVKWLANGDLQLNEGKLSLNGSELLAPEVVSLD